MIFVLLTLEWIKKEEAEDHLQEEKKIWKEEEEKKGRWNQMDISKYAFKQIHVKSDTRNLVSKKKKNN